MLKHQAISSAEGAKELICELGKRFYDLGWVTGTGGGISVRWNDSIFMAPSGVQKEALTPDMIFTLDSAGEVLAGPDEVTGFKVSECCPLFMHAFKKRNAGAVIHSHSQTAMLATLLFKDAFTISQMEMLKGLAGVAFDDTHVVPIIQNTPREAELSTTLSEAMDNFPKSHAVLVRQHGVYVWGDDWMQAKKHAECYDYLFAAALQIHALGLEPKKGSA
jgi:methylthioribulose-1-phosphate dehydratase